MPIVLPKLTYRKVIVQELTDSFNELVSRINTDLLPCEDFQPGEVEYRHLGATPRRVMALREDTPVLTPIGGGWHVVSNMTCNLPSTVNSINNHDGEANAVVQVEARIMLGDWITHDATALWRLVYSVDGGATWLNLNTTTRPVGVGSGLTQRYFDVPTFHYWGGGAGYYPKNQPFDGTLILLGSFGGRDSIANPAPITHYGVAVDNAGVGVGPLDIQFFLRTRERQ